MLIMTGIIRINCAKNMTMSCDVFVLQMKIDIAANGIE